MLIVWFAVLLICGCVSTYRTNNYYHYPTAPRIPICYKERNEILSPCKILCPPQTCASIYTLYRCIENIPCEWGCDCLPGFLRNSSGGPCILSQKCPATPPLICGKNELPAKCVACPPRTCDSIFTSYSCTDCKPGCDCIDGYLRNSNGVCVPNEECFTEPQCDVPSTCRPTCAIPNPPGCQYTPSETNQDGCNCQLGFILSEVGGKCIAVEQCPTDIGCNGDPNASVRQNPFPCPSTCDSPNARPCKRKSEALGCQCKPGYILSKDSGKCIQPDDCKGGNPCGQTGTFVPCKINCPSSYCPENDNRGILICDPPHPAFCMSGCVCKLNHRMLSRNDERCIRSDLCPPVNCTRPNENWTPCPEDCKSGYCEDVDSPHVTCNTLVLNCNPQCTCKDTYFRNPSTDICVSSEECRKINKKNPPVLQN